MAVETPVFQPVRAQRIHEEICRQVRDRLASGLLRPGEKLPSERDLAAGFGVSRGAVREALRTLENAGVVTLRKGAQGGAFINAGDASALTQPLQDLMVLGAMSPDGIADARQWVHALVARLAAERRTEDDLTGLDAAVAAIDASASMPARVDAALLFLSRLGRASHDPLWAALVESLGHVVRAQIEAGEERPQPRLQRHRRAIVAALRKRDATAACRAMRRYLDDAQVFQAALRVPPVAPARASARLAA